jgi:hypothetical protein
MSLRSWLGDVYHDTLSHVQLGIAVLRCDLLVSHRRRSRSSRRPRFGLAVERLEDRCLLSGLDYSTYLGGSLSDGTTLFQDTQIIAVDGAGNTYVAGVTTSLDFRTTEGAFDRSHNGGTYSGRDGFVAKFGPDGGLVYATYLGGSGDERQLSIAVDGAGNAYVSGSTMSNDFLTSSDRPTPVVGFDQELSGREDIFVVKLDPTGASLMFATFLGGASTPNSDETAYSIALDSAANVYVTGSTESADFPTTQFAYDTTKYGGYADAFVTKLNSTGSLVYSTYLGSTDKDDAGHSIKVDADGSAYVAGITEGRSFPTTPGAYDTTYNGDRYDGFVAKLNAAGSSLMYSTFLGGRGNDTIRSLAVDPSGIYVTGQTNAKNFPTSSGAFDRTYNGSAGWGIGDAFVTKLNSELSSLIYSTYLGGTSDDWGSSIAVRDGIAYVIGTTSSSNFPTTSGAFDTSFNGNLNPTNFNNFDAFVTALNAGGSSLVYSTFLGGSEWDLGKSIVLDLAGKAHVAGVTQSANFPTTPGASDPIYNGDGSGSAFDYFVSRLNFSSSSSSSSFTAASPAMALTADDVNNVYVVETNQTQGTLDVFDQKPPIVAAALAELRRAGPDLQAVFGNLEGAVGDLEAAVKDGLLDPVQGRQIMDRLTGIAR